MYPHLAVLDFGLNESQVAALLREGLDLVASHERYSLRELVGTLLALHRPELRGQDNLLARDGRFIARRLCNGCFVAQALICRRA